MPSCRRRLGASFAPALPTLLALVAVACADAGIAHEAGVDEALRFPGSASSVEALGRGVLSALTSADRSALEGFRLTEREHNEVVWPELPASAPELNFPVDYAWQNIQNRNLRSVERIVPLYHGRVAEYRRVECRGERERFTTFEVMTDCWVVFTVDTDPEPFEAQIFKYVLVRGGGYKIFRYYDQEPRRYGGTEGG